MEDPQERKTTLVHQSLLVRYHALLNSKHRISNPEKEVGGLVPEPDGERRGKDVSRMKSPVEIFFQNPPGPKRVEDSPDETEHSTAAAGIARAPPRGLLFDGRRIAHGAPDGGGGAGSERELMEGDRRTALEVLPARRRAGRAPRTPDRFWRSVVWER